jgi:acyl carrier protein phosphodiesterase
MNYLAHIYLSGIDEEIIIGNFIGDFVKGHHFNQYTQLIRKGIILHRYIDSFTDTHAIVRRSKSRINEQYHKYSGIIIDILYDHYLVKNWKEYCATPLDEFIRKFFDLANRYFEILPESVKFFLPSFIKNNWIKSYETVEGIQDVLLRMSKRTSLPDNTHFAIAVLRRDYELFEAEFQAYFPALIAYVTKTFGIALVEDKLPREAEK